MQKPNIFPVLGCLLTLLQIPCNSAEVVGSPEVELQTMVSLCQPIRGPNGEMIPTKPTPMPYFPFQDHGKDISHVMCTLSERSVKIFVTDPAAKSIFVADLQDDLIFSAMPSSSQPHDISYDSVTRKLYWSDRTDNRVYRADINGLNRENVTHLNSQIPYGIAIAEASGTLYILYKNYITSMSIGSNIPGNEYDFITEGISRARSLSVDETQGYLYVAMRNKIIRTSLNRTGSIEVIFYDPEIYRISGLGIDLTRSTRRIIFSSEYDDMTRTFYKDVSSSSHQYTTTCHELTPYLQDLVDVTYFNDTLYFVKQNTPKGIGIVRDYDHINRSYDIQEINQFDNPKRMYFAYIYT